MTAPGVATQFQPGNKLAASRKGKPNRVTDMMRTLVMDAAGDLGYDGKGKNGARGYLRRQAEKYPRDYLKLMGKMLPTWLMLEMRTQMNALIGTSTERSYETVEEAERALEEDGITGDHLMPHLDEVLPPASESPSSSSSCGRRRWYGNPPIGDDLKP
jgi:hypothetical protein